MADLTKLTLQSCRERLLDLGKRNRLYAYQDDEKHLPVLSPSVDALFEGLSRGKKLYLYDLDRTLEERGISMERFLSPESQGLHDEILSSVPSQGVFLLPTRPKKLGRLVRAIASHAKSAIEERGINVLYLAIGFLSYEEPDENHVPLVAPILLFPVALKKDASGFFLSPASDEGPRLNSTLAYVLKTGYSLMLPPLTEGETPRDYLAKVETLIQGQQDWSLTEEAALGIFSFAKIDAYEDLRDHEEQVLSNPIVASLFDPSLGPAPIQKTGDVPSPLPLVLSCDHSQEEAVKAFARGESFILDGPPGTGKSQTIANLIAIALSQNKRVLFVSEKMAALSVVADKLRAIGLDPFCLNLHGANASRTEVASSIRKAIDRFSKKTPDVSDDLEKEAATLKKKLSDLDSLLFEKDPRLGISPYDAFSRYETHRHSPDVGFSFPQNASIPFSAYEGMEKALARSLPLLASLGRNLEESPLRGYRGKGTLEERQALQETLASLSSLFASLDSLSSLFPALKLPEKPLPSILSLLEDLERMNALPLFDPCFLKDSSRRALKKAYKEYLEARSIREQAERACVTLGLPISRTKLFPLASAYLEASPIARVFSSRLKEARLALVPRSKKRASLRTRLSLAEALDAERLAKESEERAVSALKARFFDKGAFDARFEDALASIPEALKARSDLSFLSSCFDILPDILEEKDALGIEPAAFHPLDALCARFKKEERPFEQLPLLALEEEVASLSTSLPLIPVYLELQGLRKEFQNLGILPFFDAFLTSSFPIEMMGEAFAKAYDSYLYARFAGSAFPLSGFPKGYRMSLLEEYKKKANLLFSHRAEKLVSSLGARYPLREEGVEPSPLERELSALYRETSKKKSLPAIRSLCASYWDALKVVKPVFLMSPLSVSTYLSPSATFDVVIFDEASQVFPYDAIGALYRASQAVISGDDRQMPPSSFFQSGAMEDAESDLDSFESILDYFAIYPRFRLLWHYRSRDESLIAFSNRRFYEDSLLTFPSLPEKGERAVSFHYVENGVYRRKEGNNPVEAAEVARLVYEHMTLRPSRSLGVIAFSLRQQEAIEDALEPYRESDPRFSSALEEGKEPFFLKNLESVQGDERDDIILSLGYGYAKDGKFLHQFGPLNFAGGERRLNVAISRARKSLTLVASVTENDFDPSRCQGEGARILRDYVRFARTGELPPRPGEGTFTLTPLEKRLADALALQGYEILQGVGYGKGRVRLAVKDPKREQALVLEVDGEETHRLYSPYDREVLRPSVLRDRGWIYARVFPLDILQSLDAEMARIRGLLSAPQPPAPKKLEALDPAPRPASPLAPFPPYVPFAPSYALEVDLASKRGNLNALCALLLPPLLQAEAPCSKERILEVLSRASGRSKVTKAVESAFLSALPSLHDVLLLEDAYFLGSIPETIPLRVANRRDLGQVTLVELASGLAALLIRQERRKEELYKEMASLFGYARLGTGIVSRFDEALALLSKHSLALEDVRGYLSFDEEKAKALDFAAMAKRF